ncbi:universal stress protein [Gordonia sp. 'Campus']|uniref:universal stress protein n=1 Tax=Gordonia sp. 'Campus' TaxID=2915824 RepID=UPI001EE4A03C|nr:universal stress protein [Gordonia sp. 'Campus']
MRLHTRNTRWERIDAAGGPGRDRWTAVAGRPVVVGIDGTDAALRAVAVAAKGLVDADDLILVCATRRRRGRPDTRPHDVLKDESYLLTGPAIVDEHLRTARELATWHGARTVSVMSAVGDPTAVLGRVANDVGAGALVLGTDAGRPGWTARSLARRLDPAVELIVTDGSARYRRRAVTADTPRRPSWAFAWPAPVQGLATR